MPSPDNQPDVPDESDARDGPESLPPIDCITIENDDGPDECAMFPRYGSNESLMTTWISAREGSYVDRESIR
ncbi:hypothetical protein OB919_03885 [Halobacteria archaeon AArc-curdl1]|uniref:DUF7511 domain-containing protein n=1 Tax=Natronosalvus hydrolyticus TaxID=2979988 RepID=A0AAP2Z840_9EURY|nr:hypothetical protein [Halobacteria archaeon AArc-curdl1]